MSQYSSLKTAINANIRQNGVQAITGKVMNGILNAMVEALGKGYQFMGTAEPESDPGTLDVKAVYLAVELGTYTNYGGLVVSGTSLLVYDTAWSVVALCGDDIARTTEVVHKAGEEQIEGEKRFLDEMFLDNGLQSNNDIYLGGNQVKDMAEPTEDTDGATKKYVDGLVGAWKDLGNVASFKSALDNVENGAYKFYAEDDDVTYWAIKVGDNGDLYWILSAESDEYGVWHICERDKSGDETEWYTIALDSSVVHKTGDEEIGGVKHFRDSVVCEDDISARSMNVNGEDVESTFSKCVKTVSQSLSTDEQTIARANISVYSKTEVDSLIVSTINADY